MNFPAFVSLPSIYHDCSTWDTFWEEEFTTTKMRSFGHCNFIKQKDIRNSEEYIALEISLMIDCLYKREVTFSGSRDYVRSSGKWLTNSLTLRKKQGQILNKSKGMTLLPLIIKTSGSYSRGLIIYLVYNTRRKSYKMNKLKLTSSQLNVFLRYLRERSTFCYVRKVLNWNSSEKNMSTKKLNLESLQ